MEAPCLLVMQVSRQTKRVATDIDVALQHIGTLLGIADDANARDRQDTSSPPS
jgi:hypothetical protein